MAVDEAVAKIGFAGAEIYRVGGWLGPREVRGKDRPRFQELGLGSKMMQQGTGKGMFGGGVVGGEVEEEGEGIEDEEEDDDLQKISVSSVHGFSVSLSPLPFS